MNELQMMALIVEGLLASTDTPEEIKVGVAEAKQDLQAVLDKYSGSDTKAKILALALMSFLSKFVSLTEKL